MKYKLKAGKSYAIYLQKHNAIVEMEVDSINKYGQYVASFYSNGTDQLPYAMGTLEAFSGNDILLGEI